MKDRWMYLFPATLAVGLAILFYHWTFGANDSVAPIGPVAMPSPSPSLTISHAWEPTHPQPAFASSAGTDPSAAALNQEARQALAAGNHDRFIALLIQLVQIDPVSAAALAQSAGSLQEEAVRRVAQHWSADDPDAAEKWAANLPEASEREMAITAVCCQVAENDPESAVGMADKHGIGATKGVLAGLAEQWARRDFPAAEEWAAGQPGGENRNQIFSRLAMELAKSNPQEAVRLVLKEVPAGPTQSEAAISILYQWAREDRAGATAWVANFPPGELRERALRELAGQATATP